MSSGRHNPSRRRPRAPSRRNSQRPAQLSTNIVYHHVFRYTSTNGGLTYVTDTDLIQASGALCSSATAAYRIAAAAKLSHVAMWTPPALQGAAATCSVEWRGQANSPPVEISDTTVSTASPAHLMSRPPAQSLAAFWLTDTSTRVMTITAPVGTIIDVSVSYVLRDGNEAPNATAIVTLGATTGYLLFPQLDRVSGLEYLVPVSLSVLP
jgi:hypothetical protein